MSYGKQGYEAGKGRTFTPSSNAEWIDSFNRLLEEFNKRGYNMSRNKLTEKLIEDGLKYQKGNIDNDNKGLTSQGVDSFSIPLDQFTSREVSILKSEQGQIILKNVLGLLLGRSSGSPPFAVYPVDQDSDHNMNDENEISDSSFLNHDLEVPIGAEKRTAEVKGNSLESFESVDVKAVSPLEKLKRARSKVKPE